MEGKILAAVSDLASADYVGLYTIRLAKRSGMEVCMLLVAEGDGIGNGLYEKARTIKAAGEDEGVKVECLIADGNFEDEVKNHVNRLGSSILVVGDGMDIEVERERLKKIEDELIKGGVWGRNHLHQFLIVSKKGVGNAASLETRAAKIKK